MFVPQPGNDAFAALVKRIIDLLEWKDLAGRPESEVEAVAILPEECCVRHVTWSRHSPWNSAVEPGERVTIEDGDVEKAIIKLLGRDPSGRHIPIIANRPIGDNSYCWVLSNPEGKPYEIRGERVVASYTRSNVM